MMAARHHDFRAESNTIFIEKKMFFWFYKDLQNCVCTCNKVNFSELHATRYSVAFLSR